MAHRTKCFVLNTTLGLLACICTPNQSAARMFPEVVFFGASGTDTGNLAIISPPVLGFSVPPSPPYYMNRFTNGPNWIDVFSERLGLERPQPSLTGGTNYSYSAATTGSVPNPYEDAGLLNMDDQLAAYFAEHTPTGDELFVIPGWVSGNDFGFGQTSPVESVAFIGQMMADLGSAGAKTLLITNSMEAARTPRPDLARPFNDMLSLEVAAQRLAHPGLTIYEFDADRVLNKILADPTAIGISNVTGQACDDCGGGDQPNPTLIAENPNEFLRWDNVHFTAPVHEALGVAAFQAITRASAYLINEDFDQVPTGERPKNTTLFDSNSDQAELRPWGPGIVQVEDGKLRFQTTGPVPFRSPEEPLETGFMSLTWDASETDETFANGFLRATVQSSTASDANLVLRGNVESLSGYLFASVGPSGQFEMHRFDETGSTFLGEITEPAFTLAEEWIIEAGAVDGVISMKVWPADGPEPELPQLVVPDNGLSSGAVGLAPAISTARIQSPTQLDVTYDDVTFLPSVFGDLNVNSILDASDIDFLSAAVASDNNHPFLDLNSDKSVDQEDRRVWVEELSNTFFGDVDLNGAVEFADFLTLSENFGMEGGWMEGNVDGQDGVRFSDFLLLADNFGKVRPAGVASVPEPSGHFFIAVVLLAAAAIRRRRGMSRQQRPTTLEVEP